MLDEITIEALSRASENDAKEIFFKLREYRPETQDEAQLLVNLLVPYLKKTETKTEAYSIFQLYRNTFSQVIYPQELTDSKLQLIIRKKEIQEEETGSDLQTKPSSQVNSKGSFAPKPKEFSDSSVSEKKFNSPPSTRYRWVLLSFLAFVGLLGPIWFRFSTPLQQRRVPVENVQKRNGLCYIVNEQTPYTGIYFAQHPNGKPYVEVPLKDGKPFGVFKEWYDNGQLKLERPFKDGKPSGVFKEWYDNGQLKSETTRGPNDDDPTKCLKTWDKNGQQTYDSGSGGEIAVASGEGGI